MRMSARSRRWQRSEPGLRGYRAIIAVAVTILLVILAGVAGAFRSLLCLVDPSICVKAPTSQERVVPALPAASEEHAVRTVAGADAVVPGKRQQVAGRPELQGIGFLESVSRRTETDGTTFLGESRVVALDSLSCGTPATGPCDAWAGLMSDKASNAVTGVQRLGMLGLEQSEVSMQLGAVVDLVLVPKVGSAFSGVREVLFRSVEADDAESTSTAWTWQGSDGLVYRVSADVGETGELMSLRLTGVESIGNGRVSWVTAAVPVDETTRPALEQWLVGFRAQRVPVSMEVIVPEKNAGAEGDAFARLSWSKAEVMREEVTYPGEITLTAGLVHDDPSHAGATVVATEVLGPPVEGLPRTMERRPVQ